MTKTFNRFVQAAGPQGQPSVSPGGEIALPDAPLAAPAGADSYAAVDRSSKLGFASFEPALPNQAARFSNRSEKLLKNLETIPALMNMTGDGQVLEYGYSYRDNRVVIEISNPRIIPPRELPSPKEQFQVDCRVSIPMPSRSPSSVTTLEADFRIGDKNFILRAEESENDYTILSLHDPDQNLEVSSAKFRFFGGKLHRYSVYTNARSTRNSYSTALQRLSFILTGEPNVLVLHDVMHTNPCYQDIADAYLDSGDVNGLPFFSKKLALALQRSLGRRVHSFRLLNEKDIEKNGLYVNRKFEISVASATTFDVEVNLYDIKA